jgi:putative membrane protein
MTLPKTPITLGAVFGRGLIIAGSLMAALALQAQQSQQSDQVRSADRPAGSHHDTATCIKEAAQMNAATIKFGELGSEKGQNAELKQFAAEMQKDHKQSLEKLEAIAKKQGVELPTSLDAKCQEEVNRLQALSGAEFDKEFAKGAVAGHAQAIAHLRQAALETKDPELAQYVRESMASMKRHQMKAREVAKSVGLDQATIASLEAKSTEAVGTPGAGTQTERGTSQPQRTDETKP